MTDNIKGVSTDKKEFTVYVVAAALSYKSCTSQTKRYASRGYAYNECNLAFWRFYLLQG